MSCEEPAFSLSAETEATLQSIHDGTSWVDARACPLLAAAEQATGALAGADTDAFWVDADSARDQAGQIDAKVTAITGELRSIEAKGPEWAQDPKVEGARTAIDNMEIALTATGKLVGGTVQFIDPAEGPASDSMVDAVQHVIARSTPLVDAIGEVSELGDGAVGEWGKAAAEKGVRIASKINEKLPNFRDILRRKVDETEAAPVVKEATDASLAGEDPVAAIEEEEPSDAPTPEWSASAGDGGVGFQRTTSDETHQSSVIGKAGFSDASGAYATLSGGRTMSAVEGESFSNEWSAGYSDATAHLTGGTSQVSTEDGIGSETATTGGLTHGKGKTEASLTRTAALTDAEGVKTSESRGASLFHTDKGVGGVARMGKARTDGDHSSHRDVAVGYDGEHVQASLSGGRTLKTDDDNQLSSSWGVSTEGGGVQANAASAAAWVDEDGVKHATSRAMSGGYSEDGGFTLGASTSAQTTDADRVDGRTGAIDAQLGPDGYKIGGKGSLTRKTDVGNSAVDGALALENGELTGGLSQKKTLSATEGDSLTTTRGVSYADGKATGSLGESSVVTGEDGSVAKDSSLTLGVGEDGATLGKQASVVRKDADGKVTSAASGGVSGAVGPDGLTALGAQGSVQKGDTAVSGSINLSNRRGEPVQMPDGTWGIEVVQGAGASAQASHGKLSLGGGLSSSNAVQKTGFASREAAMAWGRQQMSAPVADLGDATTMDVGMTVAEQDGASLEAGASGGFGLVQVGASVKLGSSSVVTASRPDEHTLVVTHKGTDTVGGSLSGGTAAGSIGVGGHSTNGTSFQVKIDLSHPSAQAAVAYIEANEAIPRGNPAVKILRQGSSKAKGSHVSASLLGAQWVDGKEVSHAEELDAEGNKTETDTGTRAQSLSIPFLGHHSKTHSLQAVETNDRERRYAASSVIDSTNAEDAHAALADATGGVNHRYGEDIDGKASGTWEIERSFTPQAVDKYIASIEERGLRSIDIGLHSAGDDLEEALASAGSHDEKRAALAEYIGDGGAEAIKNIEGSVGSSSRDIKLRGDKYFTGLAGRQKLRARIRSYEGVIGDADGDYRATLGKIRRDLAFLREKRAVLMDTGRYVDLPARLRADEREKTDELIRELTGLAGECRIALKDRAEEEAFQQEEARKSEEPELDYDPGMSVASEADVTGPEEDDDVEMILEITPSRDGEMSEGALEHDPQSELDAHVENHQLRLARAQESMEDAHHGVRHRRWYHAGAREKLAYSSLFGSGPERGSYAAIDGKMAMMGIWLNVAQQLAASARTMAARVHDDAGLAALKTSVDEAIGAMDKARSHLIDTQRAFDRIRGRHPKLWNHGVDCWRNANRPLPAGL